MIKFKNWVTLNDEDEFKTLETGLEGLNKYDDFLELMNMLMMQQYELCNFTIYYDNDDSLYIEPEHFENYNEFINKLSKVYSNVASVDMGYKRNEELGSMAISTLKSKITMCIFKKRN